MEHDEEINSAAWAATRGAVVGAAKWGAFSAIAAAVAFNFSPIYRGLTFQFKVYVPAFMLQSRAMALIVAASFRCPVWLLVL